MFAKLTDLEEKIDVEGIPLYEGTTNFLDPNSAQGAENLGKIEQSVDHAINRVKKAKKKDVSGYLRSHQLLDGALIKLGVAANAGCPVGQEISKIKPVYQRSLKFLEQSGKMDPEFVTGVAVVLDTLLSQVHMPNSINLPNITLNVENVGSMIQVRDSVIYKSDLLGGTEGQE